ncbi:glycoside hydrolase family 30 protein [Mesobacillus subterraneus]|uniref:glycoside hydrolase family 30 protein n=1 Tax=Mesobacillus subterraneus TaxID=285983 RepID=UPI00273F9F41|nr:glycoside hydrolase family 30 protein [Mesobacillus subterraneus]WLR54810.1 glycoside hydrolase family 30 protein [Mesobacillus subterraneus]
MKNVKVYLTSKDSSDLLAKKQDLQLHPGSTLEKNTIFIDPEKKYQEIIGFGGAFTEATAYTLSQITPDKRQEVIESYFNQETGLGYTIGRVHIHSCDFALGNYTYVDDYDENLNTFDISRDHKWVLPLLKDAVIEKGSQIKLLASPWSPPAWMKTNNEMNNGGKLLHQYRDTWAKYYTKFIDAYEKEGFPIWGITVQNEPEAVQTWDSCIYTGEEERDFIKNYLGPQMHQAGYENVKILIWDHNRDVIVERAKAVFEDPEASKYVWGTGFHWYVSEEFENVGKVHDLYPDKHLLFTEGCQEGGVQLGEWFTGERYGRNMIGDLNNWTEGYIDWNMVLNEEGSPNHVNNLCDAPIIADTKTNEVHYNSSFYYIGHFSKFIRPGAKRIGLERTNANLQSTAFMNTDDSIALVIMNETDQIESFTVGYENEHFSAQLPPHSIATYVLEK